MCGLGRAEEGSVIRQPCEARHFRCNGITGLSDYASLIRPTLSLYLANRITTTMMTSRLTPPVG